MPQKERGDDAEKRQKGEHKKATTAFVAPLARGRTAPSAGRRSTRCCHAAARVPAGGFEFHVGRPMVDDNRVRTVAQRQGVALDFGVEIDSGCR